MEFKKEVKLRLLAEKRVYDDSPQTQVTYKDLSRLIEHILDLTDGQEAVGFKR